MPGFIGSRGLQHPRIGKSISHQLHRHRQSFARESARHGGGRLLREIEGIGEGRPFPPAGPPGARWHFVPGFEGRHRKLRTYANVGLLCVDEVGYLSFDDRSADLLYEVINRRYERKSVILTTNRPFKEWNEVFPNAACIVTLLDRLLHHADVTVIEGDSYRVRESEQETAARRRKK